MHDVADTQDTPARRLPRPTLSGGLGLATSDHVAPFQDAINVREALLLDTRGADGLARGGRHARHTRKAVASLPALGLATIVQVLPFQDSTNVRPLRWRQSPTALHEVADTHDTPFSWLSLVSTLGIVLFGLATIVQVLPFHDSIKVCDDTACVDVRADGRARGGRHTRHAVQLVVPVPLLGLAMSSCCRSTTRSTSARRRCCCTSADGGARGGRHARHAVQFVVVMPALGLATSVQVLPFQDSINVRETLPLSNEPTAVHEVADTHDTPISWLLLLAPLLGSRLPSRCCHSTTRSTSAQTLPLAYEPTAVHEAADTHDTPFRELLPAPALGLAAHRPGAAVPRLDQRPRNAAAGVRTDGRARGGRPARHAVQVVVVRCRCWGCGPLTSYCRSTTRSTSEELLPLYQ